MKLLTINTHAWLEENQDEKMEILAKTIAEKQYDVIAMQEVNQLMNSPVIYDGIRNDNYGWKLLEKLEKYTDTDYYYHWSNSHIGFGKYDEGVAIITKHPIKDEDEFYCTFSQSVRVINARRIVSITLDYEGQEIEFYSCHMNLPTCKGEDIDQNLSNLINYTDNKNLKIFMGDFNTDYFHQVDDYKRILDKGLYDTYELAEKKDGGITVYKNISGWEDSMCQKKLDYVFINRKLDVKESFVIFNDDNYPIISDHNGLEVTLAEK